MRPPWRKRCAARRAAGWPSIRSAAARGSITARQPTRPGIGLSLAKLNRVVDYPAADLTITVEAGMTIAELTRRLAAQRQRLPIDVPQPDRATVGGAVAVNAAGPRRYAYGTMRDYLLGFTAVDGTGRLFSGGGRVVKNAAGYNMCRLMAGSLGTLGVITQVTLMVRPLPRDVGPAGLRRARFRHGREAAGRPWSARRRGRWPSTSWRAGCRPDRASAVRAAAGRQRRPAVRRLRGGRGGGRLDGRADFGEEWTAVGRRPSPMLVPAADAEPLWGWLADFPADVQINVLPSDGGGDGRQDACGLIPSCAIQAHAGDGVIRVRVSLARSGEVGRGRLAWRLTDFAAHLRDRVSQLRRDRRGGRRQDDRLAASPTASRPDRGGRVGAARPEMRVMQAIKDASIPQDILNPGRFVC